MTQCERKINGLFVQLMAIASDTLYVGTWNFVRSRYICEHVSSIYTLKLHTWLTWYIEIMSNWRKLRRKL